jgi:two-component sensor histidine kinase
MPQTSPSTASPLPPPPSAGTSAEELQSRIARLETEMRELQHRAKNSLQLVLSLLRLQTGRIRDPDARAAFEHTLLRIEALAVLYRQLHEHGDGTHIDIGGYLSALCDSVRQNAPPPLSRIPVTIVADPTTIRLYEAMPLGLIVAELVNDGLRHAFPSSDPWIRITVADAGGGRARLTIEDNGRALPAGFDASTDDNLMLAEALSLQLGDTLVTDTFADGTRSTVTFPI